VKNEVMGAMKNQEIGGNMNKKFKRAMEREIAAIVHNGGRARVDD